MREISTSKCHHSDKHQKCSRYKYIILYTSYIMVILKKALLPSMSLLFESNENLSFIVDRAQIIIFNRNKNACLF